VQESYGGNEYLVKVSLHIFERCEVFVGGVRLGVWGVVLVVCVCVGVGGLVLQRARAWPFNPWGASLPLSRPTVCTPSGESTAVVRFWIVRVRDFLTKVCL